MMNKRYRHLCVSLGAPMVSQPPLNKYDSVMKITNVEVRSEIVTVALLFVDNYFILPLLCQWKFECHM